MRILHTSDWHLGKMLEQINRIEEQKEFIECLTKMVEEEKIDLILISGDVYDTYNPSAAAEELFYEAVDRLNGKGKRPVIVIAGNHDNPERLCAASPLAYKNGIILLGYPDSNPGIYRVDTENFLLVDSGPGWLELGFKHSWQSSVILTLPYPSESRLQELLSEEADEKELQAAYSQKIGKIMGKLSGKFRKDSVNLLMSHLFMRGGYEGGSERPIQVGGAFTVDPQVLPANTHFAALGHLHRPQQIRDALCPAYYSGSPIAYSFSEADYSKAVYIIDAVPGKEANVEEIILDCGKPLRTWVASKGIMQALEWCESGKDRNAWIDLEITTDRPITIEEQRKLRQLHPGIINIRPRFEASADNDVSFENREKKKIDQLFIEYYKFKTGAEVSEELVSLFIDVVNSDPDSESDGDELTWEGIDRMAGADFNKGNDIISEGKIIPGGESGV